MQKRVHLFGVKGYRMGPAVVGVWGCRGLVGHAGAVLLRACADKTGLTSALSAVMPSSEATDWWDRGISLVGTAVAIVLGAV